MSAKSADSRAPSISISSPKRTPRRIGEGDRGTGDVLDFADDPLASEKKLDARSFGESDFAGESKSAPRAVAAHRAGLAVRVIKRHRKIRVIVASDDEYPVGADASATIAERSTERRARIEFHERRLVDYDKIVARAVHL